MALPRLRQRRLPLTDGAARWTLYGTACTVLPTAAAMLLLSCIPLWESVRDYLRGTAVVPAASRVLCTTGNIFCTASVSANGSTI